MTTYSWTGIKSTDFANSGNWINTASGLPASATPGNPDTIDLAGSGVISGIGSVAAINVLGSTGGGYLVSGQLASLSVSVLGAFNLAYGGQLATNSVSVGSATTAGYMRITQGTLSALGSSLALTVSDAQTASTQAELAVGTASQAAGIINLGQGAARVGLGTNQNGLLILGNGLVTGGTASQIVIGQDNATGLLAMLGSGATIDTQGSLIIGDSGTGRATLANGGTITTGGALVLGAQDGTNTTLGAGVLQATDAAITVAGQLQVGEAGQGTFTLTVGSLGGGTLTTESGLVLGDGRSAQGTLSLSGSNWTDTGSVIVGGSGQGMLQIAAGQTQPGHATIHGAVLIGATAGTGTGTASISGATTVSILGETLLGSSAQDAITIGSGASWNSAGRLVGLLQALPGAQGSTLSVTGTGSSLNAGFLSVGRGDVVQAEAGGALHLGGSAAGTTASVSGAVIVSTGSTLSGTGAIAVAGASGVHGLLLLGGDASFTATSGPALTLIAGGLASVQGSTAVLAATGNILVTGASELAITGGTLSASAGLQGNGGGLALQISNGGSLQMDGGRLTTAGGLRVGGGGLPGVQTGTFIVNGGSLASTAGSDGGAAVSIGGGAGIGVAQLQGATWAVTGGMTVGTQGAGVLSLSSSTIAISRSLLIGTGASTGTVTADTVVSGGHLAGPESGISTASGIVVAGAGSVLDARILRVGGSAALPGTMSITGGTVNVTGSASIVGSLGLALGGTLTAASITVASGSVITGAGTLQAGSIVDLGRIGVSGGTLTCIGKLTGSGDLSVRAGRIILSQAETAHIVFGNAGTIVTPSIADLAGAVSGWQSGDAIDFTGQHIAAFTLANNTLTLLDTAGHSIGGETFSDGALASHNFTLASDGGTGTLLGYHI